MAQEHVYLAIDLKSFYASVECVERGLNPLSTHLVVADKTHTEKTICLAVTPSLKAYGISGRARLFEVVRRVEEVNRARLSRLSRRQFIGKSYNEEELEQEPRLELDYIVAPPRMAKYLEVSAQVYGVYLQYFSEEDIHVYSVDEVFIDATRYLPYYKTTAYELTMYVIHSILRETGITATAGIGTNLYLAKIAMDIVAKHLHADKDGVRIAFLDELSYRQQLWTHRPLTDFWRIGTGYARRLEEQGLLTMGDVARCSLGEARAYFNQELLYRLFGVNAELLIDHAWGYEPCTMEAIKSYVPRSTSMSTGQLLPRPYAYAEGLLIVREMTEGLSLDLVAKGLVTDQLVLYVGYDVENVSWGCEGRVVQDIYGRLKPEHSMGTVNLGEYSSSTRLLVAKLTELYQSITRPGLWVRRFNITAKHLLSEKELAGRLRYEEQDLFSDYGGQVALEERRRQERWKERCLQRAILALKQRYGKNAVLRGANLLEASQVRTRNEQIGGHRK